MSTSTTPISVVEWGVTAHELSVPSLLSEQYYETLTTEGCSERMTQRFYTLLDIFDQIKPETARLYQVRISAVTPRYGGQNNYQLELKMGHTLIDRIEITESMNDFLHHHLLDANDGLRIEHPSLHKKPISLREKFNQHLELPPPPDEYRPCTQPPPAVLPVIDKVNPIAVDKSITEAEVKRFKRLQSVFKHQLHIIQDSLTVMDSPKALAAFKVKKSAELLIQTGVHTGLSVAGAAIGALVGTAVMPAIGTIAGGFIGGALGIAISFSGKIVYDSVSTAITDRLNPNPHIKTSDWDRDIKSTEKGNLWWVGSKIKSLFVKTPEHTIASLLSGAMEQAINISVPVYDITVAHYDYHKATQGVTPKKVDKINAVLDKYETVLKERIKPIVVYLEANQTPNNRRRLEKIVRREAIIHQRLNDIRGRLS